jgi:hypothetical protein
MGGNRKYRKVYRKKSTLKNEWRYLLIITFICLILGFGVAFITGKVPSFLDRTIQKQADRIVSEKMKDVESEILEKTKGENMEDLVRKYKDKVKGY